MPSGYAVETKLYPGVASIAVKYQNPPDEPYWVNYRPGQLLYPGSIVKFTVTTYNSFTLTEWKAYHSDEYDDTVYETLTGVSGESSWTFTMPSARVYIYAKAESYGQPTYVFPPWQNSGSFTVKGNATVDAMITHIENVTTSKVRGLARAAWEIAKSNANYNAWESASGTGYYLFATVRVNNNQDLYNFRFVRMPEISIPSTVSPGTSCTGRPTIFVYIYTPRDSTQINSSGSNYESYSYTLSVGTYEGSNGDVVISSWLGQEPVPTQGPRSVRYVMSPENSGEVTGPSEIASSATSFTFTYRIKANYDLTSIKSWSVGNMAEQSIANTSYTYDGETRNYSVTVTGLIANSVGVRVIISTIQIGGVPGNNDSDGPIGGDGDYDDNSDPVPLPAMPSISVADSGLVTLFKPTISEVKELGNYLWTHINEFAENLQKVFSNPMDYIIAFNIMPVSPLTGQRKAIYIGNWLSNPPIEMAPVTNQFYEFDAGVVQINEHFGSFLDYAPNTTARIMLPFIGDRELAINEVMNKTLHLWYRIDLLSGACVAILLVDNNVYYQWSGNCAVGVPVTGSDWSRLYSGIARVATIGLGAYFMGFGGAVTASTVTAGTSGAQQANAVANLGHAFNNVPKGVSGVSRARQGLLNAMDEVDNPAITTINSSTSRSINGAMVANWIGHNMMTAVPRVQHTGDMSGAISIMGNRTPFIVLEYPFVNRPGDEDYDAYKHYYGYPSNQYKTLGDLRGYTKCKSVLFSSTKATDDEMEMVTTALKGGVYL